mmetsp:Transcript_24173/g.65452  ORF Transcript_24173/g.65452 Transcript_24173/m.65452 type:complete len:285 (-) Transcript_24173:1624-2478(-)
MEHGARRHDLLLGQRDAEHQDRRLPPAPAEPPGLRRGLQGLQDLLPPLRGDEDDRCTSVSFALPVPGEARLQRGLQGGVPGHHRERLAPARQRGAARPRVQGGTPGIHPRQGPALHRPRPHYRGGAQGAKPRRQSSDCGRARAPGQVPRGGAPLHQGGAGGTCHPDVHGPAHVGRGSPALGRRGPRAPVRPRPPPSRARGGDEELASGLQELHGGGRDARGHPRSRAQRGRRGGPRRARTVPPGDEQGRARRVRRLLQEGGRRAVRQRSLHQAGRLPSSRRPCR